MISRSSCATKRMKLIDIFRLAVEAACAGIRVLRGNADRTGIQVAHAHHHAAHGDQRRCGKAEFLRAQHARRSRRRGRSSACRRSPARTRLRRPFSHQRLMGFGQPDLPWQAGMMDGALRRGAGTAVIAGDQDDLRAGLGHARRRRCPRLPRETSLTEMRALRLAFFRS